ncbi:polysaccharide biosynthesis/export family protein [Polaribacter uvawellassae]|uniref:polysaccharide biosynthesis/export family protein n=1 Tax=Polaribacter uvawellassae TaxID=3133495 RepID=UPI00321BE5D3
MTKTFLSLIIFIFTLTSCVSKKNVVYFQGNLEVMHKNAKNFALKFKKDDLLTINVSAENLEIVKQFNLPTVAYNAVTNTVNGIPKQQSYLVDTNGEIDFPVIGKIKVEGLTRVETIQKLKEKIKPQVEEVQINIQILNFKINVMGDVKNPGTFQIANERVTVLDALALAGDLNITGERVFKVIRETNEGILTKTLDLKSNTIYSSPYFYLQQNDVVYVEPNKSKVQSASYNQNTGLYISVASVLISLISILTR